ncbi:CCA tRNA nucleotidyltransferase [Dysosmobacter sp. Sow4_B12]|uniref:CCA tRNA nucleotidyltransferase n=1 Tax=Dysosmobacter sp. Sow4_B12 TaxID=3438777 RepID=UPI003F939D44
MAKIPEFVKNLLCTLESAGHQAWCVGGCVRDLRLGRTPVDWDVTSSALPEETMALFGERAVPTGLKHGTVTVRTEDQPVEVTTFRKDGAYRDHRRPETVTFTDSLEEDLRRRDFTVNAMALDLRGTFRDPFGGLGDLERGILRCVGEPERRFHEDALRILRGLRFSACLGFVLEEKTASAIREKKELLRDIAPERVWAELSRLLTGRWADEVLRAYPEVVGVFWPELLPMIGFDQRTRHHCYDVWEHTLHALAAVEPDVVLRCTMLLHDVGKPETFTLDARGHGHFKGHPARSAALTEDMLRRLRVDNATRETVVRLVEWHDRNIPRTDQGLRRALRDLGEADLRRLLAVKRADNQAQAHQDLLGEIDKAEAILDRLLAEGACVSLGQLAVRGGDLAALGLRGPAIGRMLDLLLDRVVDGDVPNEREILLKTAAGLLPFCG